MIITALLKGWPFMASKVFLNEPVPKWCKALTIASSLSASHGVTHDLSRHELDGCTGEYQCTTWIILRIVFRKVLYFGTRLLIWHSISFLSYNVETSSLVSAKFQLPFNTVMLNYWNFETEKSREKSNTYNSTFVCCRTFLWWKFSIPQWQKMFVVCDVWNMFLNITSCAQNLSFC